MMELEPFKYGVTNIVVVDPGSVRKQKSYWRISVTRSTPEQIEMPREANRSIKSVRFMKPSFLN
jgi:hypothetical protein